MFHEKSTCHIIITTGIILKMNIKEILNPFDAPVYYKEETDSTMLDMADLNKAKHGTVIMTGYQKKGKGRGQNRIWKSSKNDNLLFTITLDPNSISHPMIRVPLICGLALSQFLKVSFGIKSELKWPNDVLVENKKISGILCEVRNGHINAGIGINCRATHFEKEVNHKATSLKILGIRNIEPASVLEGFLPFLKVSLEDPYWKNKTESILYGMGREIEIMEGPVEKQIIKQIRILGLSDDGLLTIEEVESGSKQELLAGEIAFTDFI